MANISVEDGSKGGRKSINSDVPLIPFIDLLLCCIMFLLVTAVWNQLASLYANQQQSGAESVDQLMDERIQMVLQVQSTGYVLASTAGDRIEIPKRDNLYDRELLVEQLKLRKQIEPNRRKLTLVPEDGVPYSDMIDAMDVVTGEGFDDVSISDGSLL